MRRVPNRILELPTEVRLEIIEEIWESVAEHPESVPLTAAQREDLERRWQAYEEDPDAGVLWEDFEKSLLDE